MLYNTNKDAKINIGSCYYRKRNGQVSVRKITDIKDGIVYFRRLFGPHSHMKYGETGQTKIKSFKKWLSGEVCEGANFDLLNGAEIHPSYLVCDTSGNPIFRCTRKKANFYIKHQFADLLSSDVIQLNERGKQTEEILKMLHGENSTNPFFLATKNDKCVCCGKTHNLTRHHVVPKRHKKKIPLEIIRCISNVLFMCMECHTKYERYSELEPNEGISDPIDIVNAWNNHFISTMQPKYLPEGWNIFAIEPIKMRNAV